MRTHQNKIIFKVKHYGFIKRISKKEEKNEQTHSNAGLRTLTFNASNIRFNSTNGSFWLWSIDRPDSWKTKARFRLKPKKEAIKLLFFPDSFNIHLESQHSIRMLSQSVTLHVQEHSTSTLTLPDTAPRPRPTCPAGRSAPPSPRWGSAGCQPASTHQSPHCWCQSQNSERYKLTFNRLEQRTPCNFHAGHLCLHSSAFCLLLSLPLITSCSK